MRAIAWVSMVGKYKLLVSMGVGICVLCSMFGAWAGENDRSLQRVAVISTPSAKGSPSGDLRQWVKSNKKGVAISISTRAKGGARFVRYSEEED